MEQEELTIKKLAEIYGIQRDPHAEGLPEWRERVLVHHREQRIIQLLQRVYSLEQNTVTWTGLMLWTIVIMICTWLWRAC